MGACWGTSGHPWSSELTEEGGMNQENPKFITNIYMIFIPAPSMISCLLPPFLATTMKFHARATSWWIMPCCANNLQKGYIRLDDKIGYCIRQLLVGVVIDHQSRSVTKKPTAPYTFCFTASNLAFFILINNRFYFAVQQCTLQKDSRNFSYPSIN